ncbi:ribosome assembly protein 4 [Pycnococcus provasolii]
MAGVSIPLSKKLKRQNAPVRPSEHSDVAASLVVQLVREGAASSGGGENDDDAAHQEQQRTVIPQLDVPSTTTPEQLNAILNQMLKTTEEPVPYAFQVLGRELNGPLHKALAEAGGSAASAERTIEIKYVPQATFRVRAVTRCTATLPGHKDSVLKVSFSPDGRALCSGGGDCVVRLWDLSTQTPAEALEGHRGWVQAVAWSPDAALVATAGMDCETRVWRVRGDGATVSSTARRRKKAAGITAVPTGAEGSPATAPANEGATPCTVLRGHKKSVTSVAWRPAHLQLPARQLATSSRDGSVRVWDLGAITSQRCRLTLTMHTHAVTCVLWGGQDHIYTASRDASIAVWDAKDGRCLARLTGHAHWVNFISVSTEYVLRTAAFDHTGKFEGSTHPSHLVEDSPDAAAAMEAARKRYDAALRATTCKVGSLAEAVGERLVSASDDFTMFLWCPLGASRVGDTPQVHSKSIARMTGHVQLVNQACFSPDGGRHVASASFDKAIRLWDGTTGTYIAVLRGHVGAIYQLAWSADSRLLLSGSKDSTMKVWDIKTRRLKGDLPGHADEVFTCDWSPSSDRAASGGKDKVLKLWSF